MKQNALYGRKIVKIIRDLDMLGIDIHDRRRLISRSFSLSGRYAGSDAALKEGIEKAYWENLKEEQALNQIKKTLGWKTDQSKMRSLVRYSINY